MASKKLADLIHDDRNANRGTARGMSLIEQSLRTGGAGRSVLADKRMKLIAGNKTVEAARNIGMDKIRVIETDGTELIVVKRTDLDLDKDPAARALAIADNRAGEVSLEWDAQRIVETADQFGLDLEALGFTDQELADKLKAESVGSLDEDAESRILNRSGKSTVKVALYLDQCQVLEQAIAMTENKNRGEALAEICRAYVSSKGQLDAAAQGGAAAARPE